MLTADRPRASRSSAAASRMAWRAFSLRGRPRRGASAVISPFMRWPGRPRPRALRIRSRSLSSPSFRCFDLVHVFGPAAPAGRPRLGGPGGACPWRNYTISFDSTGPGPAIPGPPRPEAAAHQEGCRRSPSAGRSSPASVPGWERSADLRRRGAVAGQQVPCPPDAGIEVGQETLQGDPLGFHGRAQVLLQRQALPGQPLPFVVAGALIVIGEAYLRYAVLAVQHYRDLVEVEAQQSLQLADACHPGQVGLRIPAQPARRGAGGDEQAQLLVVPKRPLGHAEAGGCGTDADQVLDVGRRLVADG